MRSRPGHNAQLPQASHTAAPAGSARGSATELARIELPLDPHLAARTLARELGPEWIEVLGRQIPQAIDEFNDDRFLSRLYWSEGRRRP
jgi:hypothetical protein